MAGMRINAAIGDVQALLDLGSCGSLTDAQLLERYVSGREEAAFRVLVLRHGPMVLRVCRGVLGDVHESQDAFQATFLILARKARSIRRHDSAASWLHGVARRVALKARTSLARRRLHERKVAEMSPKLVTPIDDRDHIRLLDDEIDRLPAAIREAVVLCYLEGMTYEMAASRLGVTEGTVRGRLARGRERLRSRLSRRGLLVPAPLGAGTASSLASPAVPASLLNSTEGIARSLLAGKATFVAIPAPVASLAEGVLKTMFLERIRWTVVILLTIGFSATGAIVHAQRESKQQQKVAEPASKRLGSESGVETARLGDGKADDELRGTWKLIKVEEANAPQENGGIYIMKEPSRLVSIPDGPANAIEWDFDRGVLVLKDDNERVECSYHLDASRNPMRIDLSFVGDEGGKHAIFGIYSREGIDLRCCFGMPSADPDRGRLSRPAEFETKSGTGLRIYTLRRVPTKVSGGTLPEERVAVLPPEFTSPESPVTTANLRYGDGKADGKKSLGGSGEMIEFDLPADSGKIAGLKIHGSRYGQPDPPEESFLIYFLSEDLSEVVATRMAPYSLFERGEERWVEVIFAKPVETPRKFWVALDFRASGSKGVYVSFDASTGGTHSRNGLPGIKPKEIKFGDWMIEAVPAK